MTRFWSLPELPVKLEKFGPKSVGAKTWRQTQTKFWSPRNAGCGGCLVLQKQKMSMAWSGNWRNCPLSSVGVGPVSFTSSVFTVQYFCVTSQSTFVNSTDKKTNKNESTFNLFYLSLFHFHIYPFMLRGVVIKMIFWKCHLLEGWPWTNLGQHGPKKMSISLYLFLVRSLTRIIIMLFFVKYENIEKKNRKKKFLT